ncbi:DUF3040 domain-containing protein [Thermoactinospora rubra]|uniref:DUF3040 domain-containing protein n=1 Tax=Thermoactinospora rubra TaxID=1088767 RepID=UPI000A110139|nr:DUF3040 domain-containing protein [Thermoactinospora rubra]
MAWSQDEERLLAQIEQHLVEEDPRLVARLESFNRRAGRSEERARGGRPRGRPRRSTVIILVSWLLIATLVATLLVMVLRHEAAALAALPAAPAPLDDHSLTLTT